MVRAVRGGYLNRLETSRPLCRRVVVSPLIIVAFDPKFNLPHRLMRELSAGGVIQLVLSFFVASSSIRCLLSGFTCRPVLTAYNKANSFHASFSIASIPRR